MILMLMAEFKKEKDALIMLVDVSIILAFFETVATIAESHARWDSRFYEQFVNTHTGLCPGIEGIELE